MLEQNQSFQIKPINFFFRISGVIAGPVLVALVVGKFLDKYFATEPWIFLGLTVFAFIVSSFLIIKQTKSYMAMIEKNSETKNNDRK